MVKGMDADYVIDGALETGSGVAKGGPRWACAHPSFCIKEKFVIAKFDEYH